VNLRKEGWLGVIPKPRFLTQDSLQAARFGISTPTLLYRWKQQILHRGGPAAASLDERVPEL
jgi:hypothetical protein